MPRALDDMTERMEERAARFLELNPGAHARTRDWLDYRAVLLAQEWAESEHDPIGDAERRGRRKMLDELVTNVTDIIEQKQRELEGATDEQ